MQLYPTQEEAARIAETGKRFDKRVTVVKVPNGWIATLLYESIDDARTDAEETATRLDRYEYVIEVEGGYIVITFSECYIFFGESNAKLAVYSVDPPSNTAQ